MSLTIINNLLSQDDINYILTLPEVNTAKQSIDAKSSGSVYFSIILPLDIKTVLYEKWGLQLDCVPMRWIKGDISPHIDVGATDFEKTYLAYITDSVGNFVINNEQYPISKGSSFIFNEGLYHETINTGTEPRLLLGPMSETGIQVGISRIYGAGGTTIYMRDTGSGQEYSSDQVDWYTMDWPTLVQNTDTSAGILTVEFTTDMTFPNQWHYFVCDTDKIQFGSRTLKPDGTRPIITIDGVSGYQGLITNGGLYNNGYNDIYVYNLDIQTANGSTLYSSGDEASGWFGNCYFGKSATNNYFINCSSSGIIGDGTSIFNTGGIVGSKAGNGSGADLRIIGCSTSGLIGDNCGGIAGYQAGADSGSITCESCWSTGELYAYAGGIVGKSSGVSSGSVTVSSCYSTGNIYVYGGGICGQSCQNATVSNCYSTGNISAYAGGIIGGSPAMCTITNCYSTGNISSSAGGGICGASPSSTNITYCYTTGSVTGGAGYITGSISSVPALCYSEAKTGIAGSWSTTHANSVLSGYPTQEPGIGSLWASIGVNYRYEIKAMGYSPYSTTNISDASLIRSLTTTLEQGTTTNSAVITSSVTYSIIQITGTNSGSYGTITINEDTGAISTTLLTQAGTYVVYVRNTGSYNYTSYTIVVTLARANILLNWFTMKSVFSNNSQVYYKPHSLSSGGIGTVRNHRNKGYKT